MINGIQEADPSAYYYLEHAAGRVPSRIMRFNLFVFSTWNSSDPSTKYRQKNAIWHTFNYISIYCYITKGMCNPKGYIIYILYFLIIYAHNDGF